MHTTAQRSVHIATAFSVSTLRNVITDLTNVHRMSAILLLTMICEEMFLMSHSFLTTCLPLLVLLPAPMTTSSTAADLIPKISIFRCFLSTVIILSCGEWTSPCDYLWGQPISHIALRRTLIQWTLCGSSAVPLMPSQLDPAECYWWLWPIY